MKWSPIIFLVLLTAFVSLASEAAEPSRPVVREEREIIVDGLKEQWRLEWLNSPQPSCTPDELDWMTCPCMGFAFGERGAMALVRKRGSAEEERFPFDSLFSAGYDTPGEPGEAVLRRWDVRTDDMEQSDSPDFVSRVQKRPLAKIMQLGDFDHDGRATEFIVQIGTLPCGKQMSVAVGISRVKPYLHALTTVEHPERPLVLERRHWMTLLKAKRPIRVVDWPCGDHGSETEVELELWADSGGIHGKRFEYTCPESEKPRKLIREEIR